MALGKWGAGTYPVGTPQSLLTTELNALGVSSISAASAVIDNQTNKDLYAAFHLHLASLNPPAPGYITIYALASIDGGTTYPAVGAALVNQGTHVLCTIPVDDASAVQELIIRDVLLPPLKLKFCVENKSGVAFAGTLNTLGMVTYNLDLAG